MRGRATQRHNNRDLKRTRDVTVTHTYLKVEDDGSVTDKRATTHHRLDVPLLDRPVTTTTTTTTTSTITQVNTGMKTH